MNDVYRGYEISSTFYVYDPQGICVYKANSFTEAQDWIDKEIRRRRAK